jgi:hypothetical protein
MKGGNRGVSQQRHEQDQMALEMVMLAELAMKVSVPHELAQTSPIVNEVVRNLVELSKNRGQVVIQVQKDPVKNHQRKK